MESDRDLLLLLEDQAIIAMSLQDEFEEAGYKVAGPFATCTAASKWLESQTPDVAVLDTELRDGSCKDVAAELARRRVPFIVYSGHRSDRNVAQEFECAVWIEKPAPAAQLLAALRQVRLTNSIAM